MFVAGKTPEPAIVLLSICRRCFYFSCDKVFKRGRIILLMRSKEFWLGAVGGSIGGLLGAVSGSSSLFVVGVVGGAMGFLIVWLVSGFMK